MIRAAEIVTEIVEARIVRACAGDPYKWAGDLLVKITADCGPLIDSFRRLEQTMRRGIVSNEWLRAELTREQVGR